MEESGAEFPGFQIGVHKDERVFKRPFSRLQRRAPHPLQIKPNADRIRKASSSAAAEATTTTSSSTSFSSFYQSKDPIPLLSPLVLPSLLESSYRHQEGNTAN
ncbi:hypothetical protein like AT1G69050 [Hibiscus trionum]|uniref:Uncharacterized protein n=1 Tax=Hibiscus trionum TaxID=183268 RepID=A0A9W7HD62_HIBTR|nr:hypothetical protein like AT1G69050 [Hibiscus trionum]